MRKMSEGEIRSLAVELVDFVHGYTVEFSNQRSRHLGDYDWVEERLTRALTEEEAAPVPCPRCGRTDEVVRGCCSVHNDPMCATCYLRTHTKQALDAAREG